MNIIAYVAALACISGHFLVSASVLAQDDTPKVGEFKFKLNSEETLNFASNPRQRNFARKSDIAVNSFHELRASVFLSERLKLDTYGNLLFERFRKFEEDDSNRIEGGASLKYEFDEFYLSGRYTRAGTYERDFGRRILLRNDFVATINQDYILPFWDASLSPRAGFLRRITDIDTSDFKRFFAGFSLGVDIGKLTLELEPAVNYDIYDEKAAGRERRELKPSAEARAVYHLSGNVNLIGTVGWDRRITTIPGRGYVNTRFAPKLTLNATF